MSSLIQNNGSSNSSSDTPKTEYLKIKNMTKGDTVVGTYEKSFTGGEFNQTTHYFKAEDGRPFAIDGVSMLNRKMAKVPAGSRVKVTYRGQESYKGKKGNITSHVVNVNILDGDKDTPILLEKGESQSAAASGNSFREQA